MTCTFGNVLKWKPFIELIRVLKWIIIYSVSGKNFTNIYWMWLVEIYQSSFHFVIHTYDCSVYTNNISNVIVIIAIMIILILFFYIGLQSVFPETWFVLNKLFVCSLNPVHYLSLDFLIWSYRSIYHLTMLAVPHLIKTKGNVVNVSSVNGIRSVSLNSFLLFSDRLFFVYHLLSSSITSNFCLIFQFTSLINFTF